MPNTFYGIVSGLARPSDIKNLEKSRERKLDEIINLLDRLVQIGEENFRRRWGEEFKPKPPVSLNFLPPNNTNRVVLPIGTTTTTTTTRNKGTLPLDMKEAEDNTKG